MAVRHSYKLLQELKDNNNTQVAIMHARFMLNIALCVCKDVYFIVQIIVQSLLSFPHETF